MQKTPLELWVRSKIGKELSGNVLSLRDLAQYQLEKLKETIDYARINSPFYRELLVGFPSNRLQRLEDLSQLPLSSAQDVLNSGAQLLSVSQSKIARVVTIQSSGTTAPPKRLYFTEEDLERTIDFFHYGMSTFVSPGQKVLILMPGETPGSVGDLLVKALKRMNATGIVHGPIQDPGQVIKEIIRHEIDCLVGIPVQVLSVARHPDVSAIPARRIKSVLLSTDFLPRVIVHELENLWGCAVFDHYGASEMGLGGAVECQARSGYHLREADLYFEIVDPETGEPRSVGELGEVVFTTLTRKGMPLIRYRTGDFARFLDVPCPCGTVLKLMERVRGRLSERVLLRSGEWLSVTDLDESLFGIPGLVNYDAVVRTENDKHRLELSLYADSVHEQSISNAVQHALAQVPTLREALIEGHLILEPITFKSGTWSTTGVAKRKITYQVMREEPTST